MAFENDSIKCNSSFFSDYLGKGLSGDIYGKKSRVEEVSIATNILTNVLVAYPEMIFLINIQLYKIEMDC